MEPQKMGMRQEADPPTASNESERLWYREDWEEEEEEEGRKEDRGEGEHEEGE